MGKVTRGTLLATLKELKKHKRPKPATTAVAVQAICPKQVVKVDKTAELKASIERRRALMSNRTAVCSSLDIAKFMEQYDAEMEDFCAMLKAKKGISGGITQKG